MHDFDPYQPPQSAIPVESQQAGDGELAGRGQRLGASILDGIIGMAVTFPLMYFGGFFSAIMSAARAGETVSLGLVLGWSAVGFIVFVLVHGYPLYRDGQTWGKKAAGIRIVDLDGGVPPLGRLLLLRYFLQIALGQIPFVGKLYTLVDTLFIFRQDRRCIHDRIAGTRVVRAD